MMLFYPGVHWDSGNGKARRCVDRRRAEGNGSIPPKKEVEDMAVKTSDNGTSPLFVVGDKEGKLSIAHAMDQGYRLTLDGDGNAEIVNPDGKLLCSEF